MEEKIRMPKVQFKMEKNHKEVVLFKKWNTLGEVSEGQMQAEG